MARGAVVEGWAEERRLRALAPLLAGLLLVSCGHTTSEGGAFTGGARPEGGGGATGGGSAGNGAAGTGGVTGGGTAGSATGGSPSEGGTGATVDTGGLGTGAGGGTGAVGTGATGGAPSGGAPTGGGATAGALNAGAGGDGSGGAAGAAGEGCVDRAWEVWRFRGGAALLDGELSITWGNRSVLTDEPLVPSTTTLDQNGTVTGNFAREVLPVGSIDAMGYSPTGEIALVGYRPQLWVGHSEEVALTFIELEPELEAATATHVAWDGEAFTIDLRIGSTLYTARRSASGEIVLPPTEFGGMGALSYVNYDSGYKSSTNPVSGRTFSLEAGSSRWLAGHERNGERIPWIPETGSVMLAPPPCDGSDGWGVVCEAGATLPALAADPEGGVWVAWSQGTVRDPARIGGAQHYDADGNPGPFIWFRTPEGDQGGAGTSALHAFSASRALLISNSGTALYAFDIEGSTISEARVLTDHVPDPTVNEIFRELVLLRDDNSDLTWLVFDQDARIRALKVAPGCVYPPDPDPASIIEW